MLSASTRRLYRFDINKIQKYNSAVNFNINRYLNVSQEFDERNVVHSLLPSFKFSNLTVPEYVFQEFGKYPDKIAVECAVTGKKYTYEELRRKSINFGNALRKKLKLKKGDVVGVLLPNVPDFPVCVLGALQAGLTVTTINPTYTPDEIHRQLIDSNTKVVITLGTLWTTIQATMKLLPHSNIPTVVAIKLMETETLPNGAISFQELADARSDTDVIERMDLDDLAIMPYSSGTTGIPKGVELTSRMLVSHLQQLNDPYIRFGEITTDTHQDITPGILPWFHIYGLVAILLNNLHILTKLVSLPKFTPESYLNMLDKHKPQVLYIVPPIVLFMNNSPMVQKKQLQSVHTVCSGAAPLGALDEEKLQLKADKPINIVQGYGLTESCSCVFVLHPETKRKFGVSGSVGQPLPETVVKIATSSGEALGPNNSGELLVRGPQMMKQYHNKPEESKEAFMDGWFRTGDIGYYDDNKCFYITDRLKELIKVKGFQVAPAELEEVIRSYPGVTDAAVIGVPHDVYGEVPKAYVVAAPNSQLEVEKLQEHVATKVSAFKQLRGGVVFLQNIPKSAAGKILRKDLKLLSQREI